MLESSAKCRTAVSNAACLPLSNSWHGTSLDVFNKIAWGRGKLLNLWLLSLEFRHIKFCGMPTVCWIMALCWLSASSLLAFLKFFMNKHGGHTGNAGKVKNKLPWKPTAQSLVYFVLLVSNWSILHAQRPAFTIAPWHLFEQVVKDANIACRIGYCIFCTAALILPHSSKMTRFLSF